ncbi:hypothetical protein BgiMline_008469 [Biomphalaria glabrata]|nr:hypothetical protein BgiBS90_033968 [Biomphalaria glabrata]KAI8747557.1 hypothetical protein BgiMline_019275 [Biomphalaria glabrata]
MSIERRITCSVFINDILTSPLVFAVWPNLIKPCLLLSPICRIAGHYSLIERTVSLQYSLIERTVSLQYSLIERTVSLQYSLIERTVSLQYSLIERTVSLQYSLIERTVSLLILR